MLQVLFSSVEDNLIPNHTRLDFDKVVALTHELEMKCRDDKKVMSSEFTVISTETETTLYVGTFNFGSYDYPNIYHQIKEMSQHIKVDKKNQADKTYLLEQIEKLTPDEYKKEEKIDKTLVNLDKSKISKLKKWQRIVIYSLATLASVGLIVVSLSFVFQKVQYEQALAEGRNVVDQQDELIKNYESALLGEQDELKGYLEGKQVNDNQKLILVDMYLKANEYEKAVSLMGDPVEVETYILNSDYWVDGKDKLEKLQEFNELYPTNEARFDITFFQKEYELMLELPPVNMAAKRSKMKTYALMKLDKIDEAKAELNNNNDEELKEKLDKYEILKAEISTLTEQLDREKEAKEEDKKVIKELTNELNEKKEEFETL